MIFTSLRDHKTKKGILRKMKIFFFQCTAQRENSKTIVRVPGGRSRPVVVAFEIRLAIFFHGVVRPSTDK